MSASSPSNDDDRIDTLLRAAQVVLVTYPFAAVRGYRALVAEGRRYAETEEGRELADRLARSELVGRARTTFLFMTKGLLHDGADRLVPTAVIQAFVDKARRPFSGSSLR